MDQFVTTYRKDYLWPYIRTFGKRLIEPDLYPAQQKEICPCYPPPVIENRCHESYNFDTKDQDWSRTGPMGPLLDPKLYPVKVGKSPETNTMRLDQPNMFLRKLHEKYPFLYEILQAAPDAKLNTLVNQDRLKTTYQVDYCKQEDNPPDNLMRASGFGTGPCQDSVKLPCDSYHFNAKPLIHRPTAMSKISQFESKSKKSHETNGGKGDSGMDIWTFNNTEYQDGISKIGALIIRDRLHYHNRKVH